MSVVLQFVGAGDAFGSGGRLQACMSLRWNDAHVLLDCGATSLVGLKRLGLEPASIDAIVLSHLHGDHFGGVPFFVLHEQFARRQRPLLVAGPTGTRERVRQSMEVLFPGSSSIQRRFRLEVLELDLRTPTRVGSAMVTAYPVEHASGAPALALRVECGARLIAYSGDTAWTPTLLEVTDGADVFVCESYSVDRAIRYHLDYATLRIHRDELRCRRLVLTHLGPEALARRAEIEAEIADDGLSITI